MNNALKISLMLMGGACLLLLSGGFPLLGAPEVYHSGGMLILGLLASLLCLWATWRLTDKRILSFLICGVLCYICFAGLGLIYFSVKQAINFACEGGAMWFGVMGMAFKVLIGLLFMGIFGFIIKRSMSRRLWLAMAHLGLALIAIGAYLDFYYEQKAYFYLSPQGEAVSSVKLQEAPNAPAQELGFSIALKQFDINFYEGPPFYLYTAAEQPHGQQAKWQIEELKLNEGKLHLGQQSWPPLPDGVDVMPVTDSAQKLQLIRRGEPSVKEYRAQCELIDGEEKLSELLRVNEPITHKGWQFSLLSHDQHWGQTRILILARYAPGRSLAILGMYALIISTAAWCWSKPQEKEEQKS